MNRRRALAALGAALVGITCMVAPPARAGDVPAPRPTHATAPSETVDVTGKWQSRRKAVTQTVTFRADGTLSGNGGCNSFTGTYKVDSWFITINPLATTLMACDPATMTAEQSFLAKLQSATRAEVECMTLVLDVSGGFMYLDRFTPPGQFPIACTGAGNARPFGNARP